MSKFIYQWIVNTEVVIVGIVFLSIEVISVFLSCCNTTNHKQNKVVSPLVLHIMSSSDPQNSHTENAQQTNKITTRDTSDNFFFLINVIFRVWVYISLLHLPNYTFSFSTGLVITVNIKPVTILAAMVCTIISITSTNNEISTVRLSATVENMKRVLWGKVCVSLSFQISKALHIHEVRNYYTEGRTKLMSNNTALGHWWFSLIVNLDSQITSCLRLYASSNISYIT